MIVRAEGASDRHRLCNRQPYAVFAWEEHDVRTRHSCRLRRNHSALRRLHEAPNRIAALRTGFHDRRVALSKTAIPDRRRYVVAGCETGHEETFVLLRGGVVPRVALTPSRVVLFRRRLAPTSFRPTHESSVRCTVKPRSTSETGCSRAGLEAFGSTFYPAIRQRYEVVENADFMDCPHCDSRVYIGASSRPVSCTECEADDYGPRAFLIIGGDHLLHRCLITDDEPSP